MKNKQFKVNVLTKQGRGKRAQMTLFMILGIIILFAFAFLYYTVGTTTKTRVRASVAQQAEDILNQRTTRYYTHLCLEGILKDGLLLIGKQGGYIYSGQLGSLIPQGYVQYNADQITYLVRPSQFLPPQYPCYSSANAPAYCGFINNITLYPQLYSVVYGINLLPYLQKYQGRYSIQEQLESYVSAEAPKCMPDLTQVEQFSNYQINPGDIKSEIEFAETTVTVKVDYPVVINVPNIEPVFSKLKIQATVDVRFKQLYDSIKDIIQYDNNYLDYNILDDTYRGVYQGRQLKFGILDNVSFKAQFGLNEDVFVLNDSKSIIDGKPFIFQFARKNRYPALDYIPAGPVKPFFDFIFYENNTVRIEPKAADPDEDSITYSYQGWKADYDSVWDDATRTQAEIPAALNHWEASSLFRATNRSSEITLTHADVGIHNFTITAFDQNLADYQVIRVLVDVALKAEFEGMNMYGDVDDSLASIEDPYILNATSKTILIDPTTNYLYTWIDSFANLVLHKGNISCLQLPLLKECTKINASINNMIGSFSTPSLTKVSLIIETTGTNNQTASTTKDVNVYECLPHRNKKSLPYPFHTTKDPFDADHTCCSDDFKILTGKKCVEIEEYTCYIAGRKTGAAAKAVQEGAGNPPTLWPAEITPEITAPRSDSIFRRTFTQFCGNRGNACSGEIQDKWVLYKRCEGDPDLDEQCIGPARNKSCEINQKNPECYNYNHSESFEFTFLEDPKATGICNKDRECSPLAANVIPKGNYGGGGALSCQAQCSGDGTCSYAYNCLCSKECDDNVHDNCDNKPIGYSRNGDDFDDWWSAIFGTPKNELGCDFNCQWVDCKEYIFEPTQRSCIEAGQAVTDDYCDDGYYANENKECVK